LKSALTILATLAFAGFALAQEKPAPVPQMLAAAPAVPPEAAAPKERPGPGNVKWATSADEARLRAAAESKFVFYEFTKEECGNCQRMDSLLYPAFDFEALLAPMIPVKLELESAEGKEISSKYRIEDAPSILITSAEGRLVFLMQGFLNQADFFRQAHSDVEAYRKFARKTDVQNIAKLSAKEALDSGNELFARFDPEAALPRLRRAAAAPGATQKEREDTLELLAAVELELSQPVASRKTIERLLAMTRSLQRRERAEIFRAQIPLAEDRPAEALALFRKFQKDHPTSPHIEQVNDLVERLEERLPQP